VTEDPVRERFAATAEVQAAAAAGEAEALVVELERFADLRGDERALDAGTGPGTLALALARLVREVLAVDVVPEQLEQARRLAAGLTNVTFLEGDVRSLPFGPSEFDLAATLRTLHHVQRPELVVAELVRVTRPGGRVLVIDQIAPVDPLRAIEVDRFERARDPSHARLLPDVDLRSLFEANGLVLLRSRVAEEVRPLEPYLDRAGVAGEVREAVRSLAPADPYPVELGWYLLRR
jgi:SAM-dependent methyltransferase